MIKKFFLLFTSALFLFFISNADDGANTDLLRSNGRIYVVVTVILVILFGLFLYLFRLDKKISRLEKDERREIKDN